MKTNLRLQSGFSLVELMAAVVVIGILVEIALPRVMDLRLQSKQTTNDASARVMNAAMDIAKVQGQALTDFSSVESIYAQLAAKNLISDMIPVKNQNMTIQTNVDGSIFLVGTFD